MKKRYAIIILCMLILFLPSCGGMAISGEMYNEISDYVTQNIDVLSPEKETKFYDYKATGLSAGGVDYGYYYSDKNEFLIPDFYSGNDLSAMQTDMREDDGGVYFGKPNNGTDWCFVKKISDSWYYYELHCA